MSLTKIGSIGINTGIQFAGVTTVSTLHVGSGVTLSSDGDGFFTGIITATFAGDGTSLTGVASTDNIRTNTNATFLQNINVSGTVTATSYAGSGANLTNLPAANLTGALPAISGANLTNLDASDLASGTVPTARLGSGTASSSTFLRGDSTFAAVTSTTINSNADNRIITGSGTANTLNGESTLTYDGDTLLSTNSNFVIKSIDTNTSNSENYIQFNAGYITYDSDASNSTGYSGHYFQADGAEKLRINASGQLIFDADTNTHIARPAADTLAFTTGGSERLRIRSNGRIGIGTDEATSALQIYAADLGEGTAKGQIVLKDTAAYNGTPTAGIVFQGHHASNNSQAIFAGIRGFKANTGDGDYDGCLAFDVRTHGSVAFEAMRINEHGRMGLKTTSPDATLHVGGIIDSHPVMILEGGTSSTGDLTVPHTENLQVGHWNSSSNTYTNRFQINGGTGSDAGSITMPTQPCMVFTNAADVTPSNNTPLSFSGLDVSKGGMSESNSRSRITVPTAGTYLISSLISGACSTAAAGDGIQFFLRKNGSTFPGDTTFPAESFGSEVGMEFAFSFTLMLNLSANDYLEVCFANIDSSAGTIASGYFAVSLLH